jgi:hypothetical protein
MIDEINDNGTVSIIDRDGHHDDVDVMAIMYFQPPKIDFMPSPTMQSDSGGIIIIIIVIIIIIIINNIRRQIKVIIIRS